MAKKRFLKTVATLGAVGIASKLAYDRYKSVKLKFEQEENDSLSEEVKKYNAILQNKVVEVDDEVFTGCELKAVGAKMVLDLSLAVFEKDVYIDFTSKAGMVTIVLPEGVNVACDVDKHVSSLDNLVDNTDEEGIHTVYVIGTADASRIQILPVDFYVDDEDDFEDVDDADKSEDEAVLSDGQDEYAGFDETEPEDIEELRKIDGAVELSVEEI